MSHVAVLDSESAIEEVKRCWPVFHELREHLNEEEFLRRWESQTREGYRIAYIDGADRQVVAAAGFRLMSTMAWGRIVYLDDLICRAAHRGEGYGAKLLVWLKALAVQQRCDAVHLDTGYPRRQAHLAYLRAGFVFDCHHLSWSVPAQ